LLTRLFENFAIFRSRGVPESATLRFFRVHLIPIVFLHHQQEVLLNKFRFFVAAPFLAAIFFASPALAQTATNISVISGNGQLICPDCTLQSQNPLIFFDPMIVKVTDPNGNPVAGAVVNWTVVSGGGTISGGQTFQSTTDVNGESSQEYSPPPSSGGNFGTQSNPYIPNTITAGIANNATVTFYLTQANVGSTIADLVYTAFLSPASNPVCNTCLNPGDTLSGTAGSTSTVQFKIETYTPLTGAGVPNISLRLISNQTSPSVSCATGAGDDPGSVLTDQNGNATCTIILGSTTGSGSFYALVGGVAASAGTGGPLGEASGSYNLNVTAGVPGMITVTGGNNQGGNPGQALSAPLIATVADSSGNPLSNQPVVWTVSPAGAATLSNTSSSSNANGHVQNNVTLTNTASGTIQIKVALASNPNISATFTITANIVVSGLQIISGNSQSAVENTPFGLPLVVQVATTNGTSAANIPVSFSIGGPGTLSATSAITNSAGQAQVNVTAGPTAGVVTVTATAQAVSAAFNLTVTPPGPTLTSGSFYNGADFQKGSISPCSIATIIAPGIAPALQGAVAFDGVGGLPYQLAGDTVTFSGAQAPIYNVANVGGQQQVTFQVPCSVTPGTNAVTVTVNGTGATVNVTVLPASPGLFTTQVSSTTIPVLERPNGSFVTPTNPAQRGETLIAYVTGLGPTTPAVATNSLPVPGANDTVQGTVIVGIAANGSASGESPISASLTQDIVGVYLVAFQVPSSVPSGTNVGFSISVLPQGGSTIYNSTLGAFPVQ
jgi:uncharacterized protein (TIGR03437 family)